MAAERRMARLTRLVIADSEKVRRQLVEGQGLPAAKVATILNGIDTARFGAAGDPAQARRALGLNGRGPVIGTVGRLEPVKDHATLLQAFRRVREAHPGAALVVAGDGPLREPLEAQARALGLAGSVTFLGRRSDVADWLGGLDVFVLSSVSEGLPLTVLEAMAAGVPVVSTDVGGIQEIIRAPGEGRLVAPRSPDSMAEAVLALLADEAARRAIGRAGRERVRAAFDLQRMVDAYETAYHH
jgi:glycosyltransferase involved in cell wall biosynthesis